MLKPIEWPRAVKLLVLVASLQCVAGVRAETGAEILEKTQVQGGLVLHLGCGDASSPPPCMPVTSTWSKA